MTTIEGFACVDATTGHVVLEQAPGPFEASTTTGINLKTTGQTTLYTVPAIGGSSVFIPTNLILTITNASAVTVAPVITVGVSTGLTSLVTSTTLTGLSAQGNYTDLMFKSTLQVKNAVPQSSIIQVDVTTGATATTLECCMTLFGYFIL